jgi:PD-(D/E)XK endonuclease
MRRYDQSEVDYFVIYCPQPDELYAMSFADARINASLRVEPTGNMQEKFIRWAKNYSWEKHVAELKEVAGERLELSTSGL